MNRRILLGLVIAFVFLVGLAWLLDANALMPSPTVRPGSVTPTAAPLWSVDSASINLVRIEDETTGTKVEIQKNQKGTWVIMDLTPLEANQETITAQLTNFALIPVFHDYGESLDPAEFGLAKPSYLLTIKTADGKSFALEIGAKNPTATGYYVRVPGTKRIVTVRANLLDPVIGFLINKPLPPTITPTPTVTPTITNTGTITITVTETPTASPVTPTVSGTPATATITPTVSGTPGTAVPSATLTPTP
ncbi:MAG TPA: DUF4340 domain-containing protein [Anaerolineales bacterium]